VTKLEIFENSRWQTVDTLTTLTVDTSIVSISAADHPNSIKFGVPLQSLVLRRACDKVSKYCKFKMADGRHIENRLSTVYIPAIYVRLMRNFVQRSRITFRHRSRD